MAAYRHGANSPRKLLPLADMIYDELLSNPDTPEWVRADTSFHATAWRYAQAEAAASLYGDLLSETGARGFIDMPGDAPSGKAKVKVSPGLFEAWRKSVTLATNLASKLGLDPASRARIARDLAASRVLSGPDPLVVALDRAQAEREAGGELEAGDGQDAC